VTLRAARDWNTTTSRAATVFGETVGAGYLLGALAGIGVFTVAALLEGGAGVAIIVSSSFWAAGLGGVVGLIVGFGAGLALLLLVRCGEARIGPRRVSRLIPVVALSITLPIAVLVGLIGGVLWVLAVVDVVATLTLVGACTIAHRYVRRAEGAHLH
jgi:hypothetical protein